MLSILNFPEFKGVARRMGSKFYRGLELQPLWAEYLQQAPGFPSDDELAAGAFHAHLSLSEGRILWQSRSQPGV
jgi:hypothetical protein